MIAICDLLLMGTSCSGKQVSECTSNYDCPTATRCYMKVPHDRWECDNGAVEDDDSATECPYPPADNAAEVCQTDD
ncbi:MAG: hypothetical protein CMP23_09850 [Rickettsiales bacterium]|nr:hypothetical protein [Rickettsiales bacterium]